MMYYIKAIDCIMLPKKIITRYKENDIMVEFEHYSNINSLDFIINTSRYFIKYDSINKWLSVNEAIMKSVIDTHQISGATVSIM